MIHDYDIFEFQTGSGRSRITNTPEIEETPALDSTGTKMVFIRDGDVYLADVGDVGKAVPIYMGDFASHPAFSTDDMEILFVAQGPSPAPRRLVVMPVGGGMPVDVPGQAGESDDPDW